MKRWLVWSVPFFLCVLAVNSHAQVRFDGEGRVVVVDGARRTVTLDHGPIQDLMPAGRTEFPVERADLFRSARAGDVVRFSLVVNAESHGRLSLASLTASQTSANGRFFTGGRLVDILLGVALLLPVALLVVVWGEVYRLRCALRDARKDFLHSWSRQEDIRQDLRAVVHALEEIARTVGERYRRDLGRRIAVVQRASGTSVAEEGAAGLRARRLCVVRHGCTDLFQILQECLGEQGLAQVVWDRRQGERRTTRRTFGLESRRRERRTAAPATWEAHGFVLAPQDRWMEKRTGTS